VDALHVHGDAAREDSQVVEKAIWSRLGADSGPPACLGRTREGQRSSPATASAATTTSQTARKPRRMLGVPVLFVLWSIVLPF
jgi:hypothetical protein